MLRRKLVLIAVVSLLASATACSGITSPNQDGEDDPNRCQVTQGSETC